MPRKKLSHPIELFPSFQPMKVKYKDIFDMKAFYEALHEWMQEHEWKDQEDGFDHWETYYGERVSEGGAKEMWIQWRAFKPAPGAKLTYYLDFNFHIIALVKKDVVKEGRKMSVNMGEINLDIKAFIEQNYIDELESNVLLKYFKELFVRRIYHKTINQRKKELYQETYALQNFIKQWFKMKRYLPYEESKTFFPSQAWPSHLKEE